MVSDVGMGEMLQLERARVAALYELSKLEGAPEQVVKDSALAASLRVTSSTMGYLYFVDEAEQTLTLHAWSRGVMDACTMLVKPTVYRIADTGLWGEAARQRKPVITNDYAAPSSLKRGYPEGHVPVTRHMNIPLLDAGQIVLIAGVGNKAAPYDEDDVRSLTLVMEAMWHNLRRRQLAEQVERSARLDSIGVLAGGFAHDFNNLLAGVLINVSLAKSDAEGEQVELLAEAEEAARRAHLLTRRLLTFSKGGAPTRRRVELAPLVSDAARLALRGSACTLELDFAEGLAAVEADAEQIGQVVHNLVSNALEAMPGGGRVRVSVVDEAVAADAPLDLPAGAYVRMSFEDDGPGLDPEQAARVFEPGFTTKPGGAGLGLTISHSIARKHGGAVRLRARPGTGCRFEVFLPAAARPVSDAPRQPTPAPPPVRGRRVLVVDDEPTILLIATRCLQRAGIAVTTAKDGASGVEAWRRAQASGEPFDVVLTDLTMPGGLGGRALLAALRDLDADVPVIVSSGYSDDSTLAEYVTHGFVAALGKPYTASELVAAVTPFLSPRP